MSEIYFQGLPPVVRFYGHPLLKIYTHFFLLSGHPHKDGYQETKEWTDDHDILLLGEIIASALLLLLLCSSKNYLYAIQLKENRAPRRDLCSG